MKEKIKKRITFENITSHGYRQRKFMRSYFTLSREEYDLISRGKPIILDVDEDLIKSAEEEYSKIGISFANIEESSESPIMENAKEATTELVEATNMVESAKRAVYYNTECVLFTKEEYEKLRKRVAVCQDMIGTLKTMVENFEKALSTD